MSDHSITKESQAVRALFEQAQHRWQEAKAAWETSKTEENRKIWMDKVIELSKAQAEFVKMENKEPV